jgi:hypothetical protein
MKLRIRGNSIRIRLSRTEVENFGKNGYLEDRTDFGNSSFRYALKSKEGISALDASFALGKITMYVPSNTATGWASNETISYDNTVQLPDGKQLYLLLEKDFKCIDNANEDQSDNYENPNSPCN